MTKHYGLPAMLVATLALTACSDDDNNTPVAPEMTHLRAVHLSPDGPAVDIAVDGAVALEDVTYRQASGFLSIEAGGKDVEVRAANTTTAVIDADLVLNQDSRYTVLAVNTLANIEPLLIEDMTLPASGFAQLRVVHAAPAAPAVDVYISGPDDDFGTLMPTMSNVAFKAIGDELEVAAGEYRVRVTITGESDVIFDSGTISLAAGVEYVAAASQVSTGLSPIGLTVLTNSSATPVAWFDDARAQLRVVHASADAPNVDVSLNTAEVLSDVPFGVASSYLPILSGDYTVDVAGADSGTSVINAPVMLDAQMDYTVIALNDVAEIEPLVLVDDNSAPSDGMFKLRLIHAADQAGLVDVYITAPDADLSTATPSIEDFAFKANSGYIEAAAGDYQVRITLADTKTVAIDTGTVSLSAGMVRTAVALDPAPMSSAFTALLLADKN